MIKVIVNKTKMPMLYEYLYFLTLSAKNIKDLILAIKYNDGQNQLKYIRYESYMWENYYDMNRYHCNNWNVIIVNDIITKLFEYVEGPIGLSINSIEKIKLENNSVKKIENKLAKLKNIHKHNPYAIATINECAEIFLLEVYLKNLKKEESKKIIVEKKKKEIILNWKKKYNNINDMTYRIHEINNEITNYKVVIKAGLPKGVSYPPITNLMKQLEQEIIWLKKEILIQLKNKARK